MYLLAEKLFVIYSQRARVCLVWFGFGFLFRREPHSLVVHEFAMVRKETVRWKFTGSRFLYFVRATRARRINIVSRDEFPTF